MFLKKELRNKARHGSQARLGGRRERKGESGGGRREVEGEGEARRGSLRVKRDEIMINSVMY